MDVLTLIARANDAGLILIAAGDKLSITGPKSSASAAIVKELAANKASVMAWLTIETPIEIAPDITVKVIRLDALSHTERPPLPRELWRSGIADFAQAWYAWQELRKDYFAAMGKAADGYYIDGVVA